MAGAYRGPLERVNDHCWRIPKSYKPGMRVDGLIYADDAMIELIRSDSAPEQVANVAFLPGIQLASLAMPDIHWGYGFCIGGVCATDPEEGGVISPGGVGYDINCGVRLMRTDLSFADVKPKLQPLVEELFRQIPAGVGGEGRYRYSAAAVEATDGRGSAMVDPARPGDRKRHRSYRGAWLPGRGPARPGQRPGPRARTFAMRHAGSGQSFSGSAGCRPGIRRASGRDHGARPGSGVRDDSLRLAWVGLPGVRRRLARAAQRRKSTASLCLTGSLCAPDR